MNQDKVTEAVIRRAISPSSRAKDNVYTDYSRQAGDTVWNGIVRTAGIFGIVLGSLAYFPAVDIVRQTLPMAISFLKMAVVICTPTILVIGTYQLKVAMTTTVVFFIMMFVDF